MTAPRPTDFRAILLDLDGTVLDRKGQVSPRTCAAVRRAREAGLEVTIATGRSVAASLAAYAALGIDVPAVCYNGAVVYCGKTSAWLSHIRLEEEHQRALMAFCRERSLFWVVSHEDWKYTSGPKDEQQRVFLGLLDNVREVADAEIPAAGATRVSFVGSREDMAAYDARFGERGLHEERFDVSTVPGFESFRIIVSDVQSPRCRGKAEALAWLESARGIPSERVIAIGDHANDLPMLRGAGLGVAMGNAPRRVREEADLVIGRHDEDAVAIFIEELLA